MKAAGQAKAPLVHSEALVWLHACVKDFGAGVIPAPDVVAFAVSELEHVNPKVMLMFDMPTRRTQHQSLKLDVNIPENHVEACYHR